MKRLKTTMLAGKAFKERVEANTMTIQVDTQPQNRGVYLTEDDLLDTSESSGQQLAMSVFSVHGRSFLGMHAC